MTPMTSGFTDQLITACRFVITEDTVFLLYAFFVKIANMMYAGGAQGLPQHLSGFQHYSGLYNEMYCQQHQQCPPVTAPAPPRGFFPADLPSSHHPSLPRIDNTILTYLNDVTASSSNGQSAAAVHHTINSYVRYQSYHLHYRVDVSPRFVYQHAGLLKKLLMNFREIFGWGKP